MINSAGGVGVKYGVVVGVGSNGAVGVTPEVNVTTGVVTACVFDAQAERNIKNKIKRLALFLIVVTHSSNPQNFLLWGRYLEVIKKRRDIRVAIYILACQYTHLQGRHSTFMFANSVKHAAIGACLKCVMRSFSDQA